MLRDLTAEARIACEEHGPGIVPDHAPVCRAPLPFDMAVRTLLPWSNSPQPGALNYPGRTTLLRRILLQAPYDEIRKWRNGRRNPPEWAIDTLAAHLDRMADQASEAARQLRESKKPAPTRTGLKER